MNVKVKKSFKFAADGYTVKTVSAGEEITMEEATAESLIKAGFVEAAEAPKKTPKGETKDEGTGKTEGKKPGPKPKKSAAKE